MLLKVPIVLKNALKENCIKLNFLQKTQWVHVFVSSGSVAGKHRDLPFLKYNALEWEWQILMPLSSTPGRDKDTHPLSFLLEI